MFSTKFANFNEDSRHSSPKKNKNFYFFCKLKVKLNQINQQCLKLEINFLASTFAFKLYFHNTEFWKSENFIISLNFWELKYSISRDLWFWTFFYVFLILQIHDSYLFDWSDSTHLIYIFLDLDGFNIFNSFHFYDFSEIEFISLPGSNKFKVSNLFLFQI